MRECRLLEDVGRRQIGLSGKRVARCDPTYWPKAIGSELLSRVVDRVTSRASPTWTCWRRVIVAVT